MIVVRSELVEIATTMLGVYGGLVVVLRFLMKFVIKILFKISQRRVATCSTATNICTSSNPR